MQKTLLYIVFFLSLFSCTKEIVIDLESGEQMIGIYGSITTEKKKHTIVLSRSADFYVQGEPEMISNAQISVFDGNHTILLEEDPLQLGHYRTREEIAGEIGLNYQLSVDFREKDGTAKHFTAESAIRPVPEKIDSAKVMPYTFNGREIENHLKICPYFQTIADKEMIYLIKIAVEEVLITDTLTKSSILRMGELNGLYFNGPEMKSIFNDNDFPLGIYMIDTKKDNVKANDKITIYLYSIENDYRRFIQDIESSLGSNPFMGTPTNVRSNIQPAGKAIGYFFAASMIEYSFVYEE